MQNWIERTVYGQNKGIAFTLCTTEEKPMLNAIQCYLTKKIKAIKIKSEDIRDLTYESKMTLDDIME